LNQLPDVRSFVLGRGNADAYVALKINFVPHHSPYLIMYDEEGGEGPQEDWIDLAPLSYEGLTELFSEKGFKRKDLL